MGPTLSGLLTASLLLGQTASPPSGGTVVPAPTVEPPRSSSKLFSWRQDRPILSRIQGLFGKKDTTQPYTPSGNQTIEPPQAIPQGTPQVTPPALKGTDFPRRLPSAAAPAQPIEAPVAKGLLPAAFQKSTAPTSNPIRPGFANKIGRDEKFEWITGQYEIENGRPVLYYATPETVDPHQGRVVLNTQQVDMSKLQRGDLISVRGQLSTTGSGPLYRLTSADLIERPQR